MYPSKRILLNDENESRPLTGHSKVCSALSVLSLISTRSFIMDTLVFTLDRRPHLRRIIELISRAQTGFLPFGRYIP